MQTKQIHRRGQILVSRIGKCHCGYPIFFRNHLCLHCGRALGYDPEKAAILSLDAGDNEGEWRKAGQPDGGEVYRRCANFSEAPQCNWLLSKADSQYNTLCRCCRLNRMIPDLSYVSNVERWHKVEQAKRRLVSSLIALGLPVASRITEDTQSGLAFDMLADVEPMPVTTGHHNGIITINLNEADDVAREAMRFELHEPYRTVLGHVRHESGHYYWSRLLENSAWHEQFRALFGDERQDYVSALQRYYIEGPDPTWEDNCVSAYASAHPWEDWAETWAHYLHMLDTMDTAMGSGIGSKRAGLMKDPFDTDVLYILEGEAQTDEEFLAFFNAWAGLTSVLNEFSLGMGQPDFYPFVLSKRSITKLHFVHRFLKASVSEGAHMPSAVYTNLQACV
ncbi:MAG: putative zinc-binding metallopeptidase [Rhodoferax sp.]|nr:putative zinc-binding metallopeptidase [Rhodoferax sp.]